MWSIAPLPPSLFFAACSSSAHEWGSPCPPGVVPCSVVSSEEHRSILWIQGASLGVKCT